MFINGYPYTDFHEMNLDWCISAVLQLQKAFEDFSAGNKLTFADPLQHYLTKTYAKNTIVIAENGNAYLSLQPVPKGVDLTNTDYWLMVFDFTDYSERANKNFTDNYFENIDRSPVSLSVGDWLVLNDVLYKVISAIVPDDLFEAGVNIEHFTVEQFLKDFVSTVNQTLTNWYNQMTGTINQYKNDIDASELQYRLQLAQDIANTTASLQAQLDAAISGATVDSEVINARVGFDGTTYSTLGDAIRTQAGDAYRLAAYQAHTLNTDYQLLEKASISNVGGIYSDNTYDIQVFEVSTSAIDIDTSEVQVVYAFFTTKPTIGSTSMDNLRHVVNASYVHGLSVPNTAKYVVVRTATGSGAQYVVKPASGMIDTIEKDIVNVKNDINDINENVGVAAIDFTSIVNNGAFVSYDGSILTHSDYMYTDPIHIEKDTKIVFTAQGYSTNVAMISTCESDGTGIICVARSIDSSPHDYVYVARSECYIILSCNATVNYSGIFFNSSSNYMLNERVNDLENNEQSINPMTQTRSLDNFVATFRTVGAIGDSLADGTCEYDGGSFSDRDFSWIQIISKLTGITGINFTRGGLTTRTALRDFVNPASFATQLCDAYIIGLGVNDRYYYYISDPEGVAVGTSADIDLNDRTNNADTYYGNYASIIQRIKEVQPKAKIFIITNPTEASETQGYNDAVRYMATIFSNVYVLDFYAYGMNEFEGLKDSSSAYWQGSHSTALGYYTAAWHIMSYIEYIIKNNALNFKDIQFIGTNYDY